MGLTPFWSQPLTASRFSLSHFRVGFKTEVAAWFEYICHVHKLWQSRLNVYIFNNEFD